MYTMSNRNEGPLTPVSDKHVEDVSEIFFIPSISTHSLSAQFLFDDDETTVVQQQQEDQEIENDQVFQRIKSMLEGLILQAEVALLQKTNKSGKVLQDYSDASAAMDKQFHVQGKLCAKEQAETAKLNSLSTIRNITQINSKDIAFVHRRYAQQPLSNTHQESIVSFPTCV